MPLTRGHYAPTNPQWLLEGQAPGVMRSNLRRVECGSDLAALTTQVMTSVALPLEVGDLVTSLTFVSGATAAGVPTNWWVALFDDSATPALLQQSADQLTAAWAANTAKTLALASPVLITRSGVYRAAVMVKATTTPTLVGAAVNANASGAVLSGQKALAQTSGSALVGTAPATVATPTTVGTVPLAYAS
jgi:hypothetical protein